MGVPFTLSGSFVDPGILDTHTVAIDWTNDGINDDTVSPAAGVLTYSGVSHTYTDLGAKIIKVTITDKDGGSVFSTASVEVVNAPPTVAINGAPTESPEGTAIALTSTVTDDVTPLNVTYLWHVTKGGVAYGTDGTADAYSFTPDDNAEYVVALTVTDNGGTGASNSDSKTITVTNVVPTISGVALAPATIAENGSTTLSGTIADAGTLAIDQPFTLDLNWGHPVWTGGPAVTQAFTLGSTALTKAVNGIDWNPATGAFAVDHQYLDNPAGPATEFTITATATDNDGGVSVASTPALTVNNAAPVLANLPTGSNLIAVNGSPYTVSGITFTDAGTKDTHTATIDWGDSSPVDTVAINPTTRALASATHTYATVATRTVTVTVTDAADGASIGTGTFQVAVEGIQVVGGRAVYNGSRFDAPTIQNPTYSDATAVDKSLLSPGAGAAATFANYTSYSKGINAIAIDVKHLDRTHLPTAADFAFRHGNTVVTSGSNTLEPKLTDWTAATPTSVVTYPGAGVDGSDRVVVTFADNVIQKKWLQVTVLAGGNLGLDQSQVFYLGNAIGETGNSTLNAQVTSVDSIAARNNPHTAGFDTVAITDLYDFNRDGSVNSGDELASRGNPTNPATALKLIQPVDTLVTLTAPAAQPEGTSGTTTFNFVVTLSSDAPAGGVTVLATTANGTAGSSDFNALTAQPYTVPAGQRTVTIPVTVNGDADAEGTENFSLSIGLSGSPAGARLNRSTAEATIFDGANQAPVAGAFTATATTEDATRAGNINTATDPNSDTLTFTAGTVTSARGGSATIAADGSFTYDPRGSIQLQSLAPGQSAVDSFSYTVSDGKGGVSSGLVSVTVNGAYDTILGTDMVYFAESGGSARKVAECPSGTVIGTLQTTKDIGASYTYAITSGTDAAKFQIVGNQLLSNAVLDYETKTTYSITVRSTRADGAIKVQGLVIQLANANETPTLDQPANVMVDGGATPHNVALTGITNGGDTGQAISVTATSSNTGLIPNPTVSYTSPNATGTLTYTPVAGMTGQADITVTVRDAGLNGFLGDGDDGQVSKTFTVSVTPMLVNKTLTISEGQTVVLSSANLSAVDDTVPAGDLVFSVSDVTGGQFELVATGAPITTFTQAQVTAGAVQFEHDGGEAAPAFSVTVSDGTIVSQVQAATIVFTNVNDMPVNTVPVGSLSVNEDTDLAVTSISIADTDDAGAAMRVTLSVEDGTLTVDGAVSGGATVTNSGTASVTLDGTKAQINTTLAATNAVIYRGDLNYNGADTLTVLTSDLGNTGTGGAQTDLDTVAIDVTAVNDAPTAANGSVDGTAWTVAYVHSFAPADFQFSDVDSGDSLSKIEITDVSGINDGVLFYDADNDGYDAGEDVTVGLQILAANIAKLKFQKNTAVNDDTFKFSVFDQALLESVAEYDMLIDLV
jgi:VCBS repeat-containing protein